MAAEKQPIVIKKITIAGAGAHGGAWKVAFADFMTAMMCFFLVMWLLNQTEEVKKQVASHFSGPSMMEQNLQSFGVEITLEKLFLDLTNDPLRALQAIVMPASFSPDIMSLGTKKMVMKSIANELGEFAQNVKVDSDEAIFEIPDHYLFDSGSDDPSESFVNVMEKLQNLTKGLENSYVKIDSQIYDKSVEDGDPQTARKVAERRMSLIKRRVDASLEHKDTVSVMGKAIVTRAKENLGTAPAGTIRIQIKQKEIMSNGRKPRQMEELFQKRSSDMSVYDDFVRRASDGKKAKPKRE
jgi:chemotaxis protein MotB